MSTAPANEAPDSLQPPAFVAAPAVGAPPRTQPAWFPLPWDRLPARRRTLVASLKHVPHDIAALLERSEAVVERIAQRHYASSFFLYLGRHTGLDRKSVV